VVIKINLLKVIENDLQRKHRLTYFKDISTSYSWEFRHLLGNRATTVSLALFRINGLSYIECFWSEMLTDIGGKRMTTPSMEDYLERIYKLIDEKGYARVSDIAEGLQVHPSSVTKMIQKLDKDNYLVYEKYRGLILTSKGKKMGKRLMDRHRLLEEFLTVIGVQEGNIYGDVEGIEHHLSWDSITCIETLLEFFRRNPSRIEDLNQIRTELDQE
jgi:Mn-dependent DtxR family transcriptional regulator